LAPQGDDRLACVPSLQRERPAEVVFSKVQLGPFTVASLASQAINTASNRSANAT